MFLNSTKNAIGTLGVTSVLMLSGSVHAQNIVTRSQPAAVTILDSTKEQDGLNGSVRRVRTESAKLDLQGERLLEGPRQLLEITTYGVRGNRVENVSYPSTSSLVGKEEYKYDAKGNIVEMTLRDESGTILSREAYDYEFDRFGNWTKMVTSLLVFEGGALKHEPIEVTYRTLTYYFDDQIAKIVEPASREKMPDMPAATGLQVSNILVLANGPTPLPGSDTAAAPLVSGFDPPPELTTPVEPEKTPASSPSDNELPIGFSVLNAHPEPELTKPVEPEKTPASTSSDNELPIGFSVLNADPESELTKPAEAESTSAPAKNDSKPPNGSSVQPNRLTSSSAATNTAANEAARVEEVASKNAPPKEIVANTKGFEYFKAGRNRFDAGDLKGAVAAYLQSIELQGDSAEVYLSLGLAYLKLEKNKDAAKAFKDAVRLEPDLAEAQYGLGLAYFRIARHKDAADAFKRATVLRPDMAKAHYGLALAYQELGKNDALIVEFRILQTLDANLAKQLSLAFPESNLPCGFQSKCK
jgi:Tfp pilus assembly protein PilF